ncbi:MAG: hypothetical protein FWG60_04350 [Methanomassiliicoccaceae archaeon]|nr:hypothetical protein [Methanomassiliicoccaceae archaeon]
MILIAVFINSDEPENKDVVGIAYDVKTTKNGYTFLFEDSDGGKISCFSRSEPEKREVYSIRGAFSDDGGMFFIDTMNVISQNVLYHN